MKMAVRFSGNAKFLLVLMGVVLLGACGGNTNDDLTSPTLTMDAVDPSTFNTERILSGRIEAGAELVVDVSNGATAGEDADPAPDTWEVTISNLAVGSTVVTVTADDDQGNNSSLQFVLVRDIVKIDQAEEVTNQSSSTVYGRLAPGTPGADITSVTLNGAEVDPIPVTKDGDSFSLDLGGLVAGSNKVVITAQDAAADTQKITLTIVSDAEAVPLTIAKPVPIDVHDWILSGTVGDGGAVAVSVEPAATHGDVGMPTTTSWQLDITDLQEQDSIARVTATQEGKTTASAWTRIVVVSLPTVVDRVPTPNAPDVPPASPDTLVKATFSEAVVASKITFQLEDALGNPVAGDVSYDAEDASIVFTPEVPLAAGDYTATVSGVQDPEENPIATFSWDFTVQ